MTMVTTLSALVGFVLAGPFESLSVDDAFARVTSLKDVHAAVMKATVALEAEKITLTAQMGTGFFVWKKGANGRQRVFVVTAAHLFENVKRVTILGRRKISREKCISDAWGIPIFDDKRKPLWLERKDDDLAVVEIENDRVPCVAIPVGDLATTAGARSVGLGDEVFAVGYPFGMTSTSQDEGQYGFLRAGRVAGYPALGKSDSAAGIFFEATVGEGYSGAPLYWVKGSGEGSSPGTARPRAMVVGVVTQSLRPEMEDGGPGPNVAIGFAALAAFARELIENAK